jgi:hypothetical protein
MRRPDSESRNLWMLEFAKERNERSANVNKQLRVIKAPLRLKRHHIQGHPLPAGGQRGSRAMDAQVSELPLEEVTCWCPLKVNQPGLGDVLLRLTLLIVRLPMLIWDSWSSPADVDQGLFHSWSPPAALSRMRLLVCWAGRA